MLMKESFIRGERSLEFTPEDCAEGALVCSYFPHDTELKIKARFDPMRPRKILIIKKFQDFTERS